MQKFIKSNVDALKDLLYSSYIHDAYIENIICNCEDNIEIELVNKIFNVRIHLTFRKIVLVFAIKGNDYGSRRAIVSLTVEDNVSYLSQYVKIRDESMNKTLYLLFQMFSGDELHILSQEVIVKIKK